MKLVRDLMSTDIVTTGRNDVLTVADDLMKTHRVRHMPVLDEGGKLAGIVSQRDLLLNALVRALGFGTVAGDKMKGKIVVKEVMTTAVVTTTPTTPLDQAAGLMLERKIGCLPVVDDGVLVGILTEGDFVAAVARGGS